VGEEDALSVMVSELPLDSTIQARLADDQGYEGTASLVITVFPSGDARAALNFVAQVGETQAQGSILLGSIQGGLVSNLPRTSTWPAQNIFLRNQSGIWVSRADVVSLRFGADSLFSLELNLRDPLVLSGPQHDLEPLPFSIAGIYSLGCGIVQLDAAIDGTGPTGRAGTVLADTNLNTPACTSVVSTFGFAPVR